MTVESVDYRATVATTVNQLHITKLAVSVNGARYTSPEQLAVPAGAKLRVRISTAPYRSAKATTTTLALTVPKSAKGRSGALLAIGGASLAQASSAENEECIIFGEGCSDDGPGTLTEVISTITEAPKNNAVQAQLVLQSTEDGEPAPAVTKTRHMNLTVTGRRDIPFAVR